MANHDSQINREAVENLLQKAHLARRDERNAEAKQTLLKARKQCQEAKMSDLLARTLAMLGQIERDDDQIEPAVSYYTEALNIYRTLGNRDKVAHTVRHLADIQRSCGKLVEAESNYDEALKLYRDDPETVPLNLANAIRGLALLKEMKNETYEARLLWQEAQAIYETSKITDGVQECKQRLAELGS